MADRNIARAKRHPVSLSMVQLNIREGGGLKHIYYAENQMPSSSSATILSLRGVSRPPRRDWAQLSRLEQYSRCRRRSPWGIKCPGKEGAERAGHIAEKNVVNAAICASTQAVEHYEMTRYGASHGRRN